MWQTIQTFIETNPTLTAIYSGAIGGSLFYYLKGSFSKVFNFLDRLVSFDVQSRVLLRDGYLQEGLLRILEKSKCLYRKDFELSWDNDIQSGFGSSWYIIQGKLVRLTKSIDQGTIPVVTMSLKVYFCLNKEKWLKGLSNLIKEPENPNLIDIFSSNGYLKRSKRFLDTVYLRDNIGYNILNDIKTFINTKDFYSKYSIPYKRNYLLYGKPGTGKTSLILALASELGRNIILMNLNKMSDIRDIVRTIIDHQKDSIIVFEDIDAQTNLANSRVDYYSMKKPAPRRKCESEYAYDKEIGDSINGMPMLSGQEVVEAIEDNIEGKLSLSQLLNLFDGLQTIEGTICIFTTNHINKLDPALLRKGRMDYIVEIKDLDLCQSLKMIKDKLGLELGDFCDEEKSLYENIEINPANLQEIWMSDLKGFCSREETLSKLKYLFNKARGNGIRENN